MDSGEITTLMAAYMKAAFWRGFHMDMADLFSRMGSTTMEMWSLVGKMVLELTNPTNQPIRVVLLITFNMEKVNKREKITISRDSTNMGKKERASWRIKLPFMKGSLMMGFSTERENWQTAKDSMWATSKTENTTDRDSSNIQVGQHIRVNFSGEREKERVSWRRRTGRYRRGDGKETS